MRNLRRALFVATLVALATASTAGAQPHASWLTGKSMALAAAPSSPPPATRDAAAQEKPQNQTPETPAAEAPPGEATAAPNPWPFPFYMDRRFEEAWRPPDWKNPYRGARDFFDKIKAIRLNDTGSVWVGFGGQARARLARQSTVTYGGPGDFEPTMWTWRFRGYSDLHFGNFRVYGEGIYSHSTIDFFQPPFGPRLGVFSLGKANTNPNLTVVNGRLNGTGAARAPNLNGDLLNLFGEYSQRVKGWNVGVWGGRRELQMGHERIISPGNWLLNRHTFDGAGVYFGNANHRVDGFVVNPDVPVPDMYNEFDKDTVFSGVYYTTAFVRRPQVSPTAKPGPEQRITFQPYLLHIKRNNWPWVQHIAEDKRMTFGFLTYGDVGGTGFDFEVEAMYQYGWYNIPDLDENINDTDQGKIHAYAATVEFGHRFKTWKFFPRPYVSFDYASGDSDANDDRLGTFDPLYPLAYAFFGFHAAFERKNFMTPGIHLDLVPVKNVYFKANYFPAFMRAQKGDGVYDSFRNIVRRPEPNARGFGFPELQEASRNLGQQVDFGVAFLPSHHWLFYGTYLRFFAGPFFEQTQTAPTRSMHGVMLLTQFNF